MKITGRILSEDPVTFFAPLTDWARNLTSEYLNLEVKVDYMNTAAAKMMNDLIKTLDANSHVDNKVINWYYEEDDEDMMELGQIIEENTLNTSFFYHEMIGTL